MLRLFACVLLIVFALPASAQDNCQLTILGQVVDEHDGSGLSFADIAIVGTNMGTISDESGYYSISGLCPGKIIIACFHVGCEPIYDTLEITQNTMYNFYPEHHAEMLDAVRINEDKSVKKSVSNRETVANSDREKGKTLGASLGSISGVNTLNTGASIAKPMIHGLHSNRLLVLNNGVRQEGQQWGNEHAPEIDPFIANELTVIKGASGVRYGSDAIAGVVIITPKALPDSFGLGGTFDLVGQSNGRGGNTALMLEGRHEQLEALKWRVQGSTKKLGNQKAPEYFLKNTGLEEWNFSSTISLSDQKKGIEVYYSQFNTNLGIFSASHIGNLTDLYRAFEASDPIEASGFEYEIKRPYQRVTHELLKASSHISTGAKGRLEFTYARQYNLREEFDKHDNSGPALSFEITTHTTDLCWMYQQNQHAKLTVGAAFLTQNNTYSGRFFIPNFKKWAGGLFAIQQMNVGDEWLVEFGARFDYVQQLVFIRNGEHIDEFEHRFQQPSGTVGLSRDIGKNWNWRSNLSTAWRPPNVNELYSSGLHHGSATYEIGDTSLRQESSFSWDSELRYSNRTLELQGTIYANYMNNFINLQPKFPATLTIRGAFPTFEYVQTNALLYGLDAKITYHVLPALTATSTTSVVRARDLLAQDWLAQMPADQTKLELAYTIPKLKTGREVFIAINANWVNKQWRLPPMSDYVAPPNDYMLIGFFSSAKTETKLGELGINFEINNVLNQRYRNYLNRYRYYSDELGRNLILRLSLKF